MFSSQKFLDINSVEAVLINPDCNFNNRDTVISNEQISHYIMQHRSSLFPVGIALDQKRRHAFLKDKITVMMKENKLKN